jgi:hypothetical protein
MNSSFGQSKDWPLYSLFGLSLASDFRFVHQLAPSAAPADITFTCTAQPDFAADLEPLRPVHLGPRHPRETDDVLQVYQGEDYWLLRFTRCADFYLWPERIVCHLRQRPLEHLVELRFLGPVLAFWLEWQHIPVLHASAVAKDGQAIAFLSERHGGKSTLATMLLSEDYALLTDDLLALERRENAFFARPGYPSIRVWPESPYEGARSKPLHPQLPKHYLPINAKGSGSFCSTSKPLRRLYLLRRDEPATAETKVRIRPIAPADALIELVKHSYLARVVDKLHPRAYRLQFFTQLIECVPVKRLAYPSGSEYQRQVSAAIQNDAH